jgi:spermidine synthase
VSRLSQSQPGASQPNRRWGIWVLCCFVFISGGASLVYEVVWSRQLATFLGITGHAHTAVIAAFMAGLALGSLVAGRLAVRVRHPIRWYAIVEILIGCYALASPWIFTLAEEIYAVAAPMFGIEGGLSHTFRLVIAFACVLLPTFLMGTTLPLLVQGIPRNRDACRATISKLYGVNTLGAALGTFAAGYLLLPLIGVQKTSAVAAFASILAGTGVLAFCRHMEVTEFADRHTRPAPAETGKATHGSSSVLGSRDLLHWYISWPGFARSPSSSAPVCMPSARP